MQQDERFRFLAQPGPFPYDAGELALMAVEAGLSDADMLVMDQVVAGLLHAGKLPFDWGPQEHHFIYRCQRHQVAPYLVYRYKMATYPRQRIVADFPVYLLIEPASPCNLRCVMCFQVDKEFTRKSNGYMGYMDMDLYRTVVDQAADGGTRALTFASRGEPLLHKGLPDMLRYAAEKDQFFDIKVNTNGTLLDERAAHAILDAGVSIVVVSVDSIEPQQYSRIRVRGEFDDVLDNVRRFVDIRDRHYPGSRTEIRAAGVNLHNPRYGKQDEGEFGEFWGRIADTVAMADAEERWDTYNNRVHPERTHPCDYLWERMYVWWDGQANVCDVDYRSLLTPGRFPDRSLSEIWHGEAYTRLREAHLAGLRGEFNPCDRCGV